MQLCNDSDLQLFSGHEGWVFTLKAIQVLLFITLVMICESKTLKNNIFLELQCTCISAQGYSRPVLLSFHHRSSEQGINPPARPS